MTPEEAFLNDVSSWPIYADWLEEQGQPQRAALFRRPRFRNSIGMDFVLVPRGKFWMGGGGGLPGERQVTIRHDFYLGAYPVTQEQWLKLMSSNPSWFSRAGEGRDAVRDIADRDLAQFPVEQVTWFETFLCRGALQARETDGGWRYRLPTEEEWEYACRGAPVSKEACAYHFYFAEPTNDLSSQQANFDGNFPAGMGEVRPDLARTTRVGSYQPNRLGLYDMHGNVREWTITRPGWGMVFRGGSWYDLAGYCTAAYRDLDRPGYRRNYLGFRLLAVPAVQASPGAA